MFDPKVNAAILEVVMADEDRMDQAWEYALKELVPDIPKYVQMDDKEFRRWWKAVRRKADEIFSRLN
jgi:hypothetical protein